MEERRKVGWKIGKEEVKRDVEKHIKTSMNRLHYCLEGAGKGEKQMKGGRKGGLNEGEERGRKKGGRETHQDLHDPPGLLS